MVWDHLQAALDIVLTAETVLALFGGVVIGAIPGMTVTMSVALTLPFTFNMHPAVGILLLLGAYKGGVHGGSITAIPIKTLAAPPPRTRCWTAIRCPATARRARLWTSRSTHRASRTSSRTSR